MEIKERHSLKAIFFLTMFLLITFPICPSSLGKGQDSKVEPSLTSKSNPSSSDLVLVCIPIKEKGGPFRATVFALLGGIGLFMFGIHLMSDGLQKAAGSRIKTILSKLTGRPIYGFFLGALVTAIIQSSSATTVMLVGLVNAGLLEFVQSVGVILGANVGTTVTTQVVALKLDQFALPAIGLGMILYMFFKKSKVRHAGLSVLGFGLLFLGIVIMKNSIPPDAKGIMRSLFLMSSGSISGTLLGLMIGTAATAIVQSSSITVSLIVILALQGLVTDLREAIPLILGCNIGTCTTALLAALKTSRESQRAAIAHTFFNVFGAVLTLTILYPFYLWFIPKLGGNLAHQIANLHVAIKLVDAILFIPITKPFATLITRIVPAGKELVQELSTPRYLLKDVIDDPPVAIELAVKELVRLGALCRTMVKYAMNGFTYNDTTLLKNGKTYGKAAKRLRDTIMDYIITLSASDLSEEDAKRVSDLFIAVYNFDRIMYEADRLIAMGKIKAAKNIPLYGKALEELKRTYREVDYALTKVSSYLPQFKR